ncbi:MAG: hypothetical protein ACYS4W_09910, partial [Planctomycetota bacterium]
MKDLEIRKPAFLLLPLMVLFCFTLPCLAQTRDFWLKGVRESTGQGYVNIHFVIIDAKEDKIEYRVDAHVKVFNDE